ncbi:MAG: SDR family oxidoreductase [Flavobacteriales bacterium]|nr:SDR family oxidoreductase [Flavobacteriales bacterium]
MNNTVFHLHNKTILITGASSGIGREIAITLAKMGGQLVITGRNENRLKETFSILEGDGHKMLVADLTDENQIETISSEIPKLDGVVLNAGVSDPFPIKYITSKKIEQTFSTNFNATVLLIASLLRKKTIKNEASIVFISSISANFPSKGGAMYGSSKAAIENFSKVLALELSHQRIRSNCIAPGMVKTKIYDDVEKVISKEAMDKHIEQYPLGVGFPEDVANSVVFLLSNASRWITGTSIVIDGGYTLKGT